MSPDEIRRELGDLQISVLHRNGQPDESYGVPSRGSEAARQIYRCLGLKWNRRVFPIAGKRRARKPRK